MGMSQKVGCEWPITHSAGLLDSPSLQLETASATVSQARTADLLRYPRFGI